MEAPRGKHSFLHRLRVVPTTASLSRRCLPLYPPPFIINMSRTLSNAPGSDSPLKAHLVAKAPLSSAKLTRKDSENHRELCHDMLNLSLVVEPEKFLEFFVPEPTIPAGKEAHEKLLNPFMKMRKPTTERKMYEDYVSHIQFYISLPFLIHILAQGSEQDHQEFQTQVRRDAVQGGQRHRSQARRRLRHVSQRPYA